MSLLATTTFANPDPDAAPATLAQLIALLNVLVTSVVPGDYLPYVVGSTTPGSDDQDKIWHKLDGAGRPLGTYKFYSGIWRREYSGLIHEVTMYSGNPSVDFDGTGLGIPGGQWDGWALANGMNGTANLSNMFIVGGAMDNVGITGYSGGLWRSNVAGGALNTGGAASVTLDADTTFRAAADARGPHDIWMATGNTRDSGGDLWGVPAAGGDENVVPADPGNPTPDPISIVPPFYSLAFAAFIGYA